MAFGGGQINQPAFAQQVDLAAIAQRVLFDELARGALGRRHFFKRGNIHFYIEVAGVGHDRAVLHYFEVIFGEHVLVAGDSAEDVAKLRGFGHGHHAETVHGSFERLGRVDLGDNDLGSSATRAAGETAPAPAVAGDDEFRSCKQKVGRANDAIDGGLSSAVAIVEEVLGVGVVDGDNGILQHAFFRHSAQANDAGGGFFGAADHAFERVLALGMEHADQVGAVVHGDVRLVIERGEDVVVVGVVVLALDRENRDVVVAHQRSRDVILRGKRIRGAEHDVGATVTQANGQVRRFGSDVQASGNARALQWLVLDEFFADDLQDLHGLIGPLDPLLSKIGKLDAFDVVLNLRRYR